MVGSSILSNGTGKKLYCGIEESGRPREPHKLKIVGSNPSPATSLFFEV